MKLVRPVMIKNSSFNTCKYGISILMWLAVLLRSVELLIISGVLLGISAKVGVTKSPLVLLGNLTISRVLDSKDIMLDENGMRFAHTLGFILVSVCIMLVVLNVPFAWFIVFLVALMKTISAVGYCSGLKLYQCMNSDDCCKISSTVKKVL